MSASSGSPDADGRDEPENDFLELDQPERRHRTFERLGLLVLGVGGGLFLVSLLLTSNSSGSLLDLLVLALWLGSACLVLGGIGLLAVAGVKAIVQKDA